LKREGRVKMRLLRLPTPKVQLQQHTGRPMNAHD